MAGKILSITWLHGQFQAASLAGSTVLSSWNSPQPVEDETGFDAALEQAVRETRFAGQRVVVLLEHRNLLFHVQDTPPARGRMLRQLLERLVSQNRFFEEQVAWGRAALPSAKDRHRHLLALLPESLVNHLRAACENRRLQLAGVLPLAAAFGEELRGLRLPAGETVVLAADGGGALNLLLGQGDGQILFSRSVLVTGAQKAERAAQEVNRTLHYAQQQFGATVNHIFVLDRPTLDVLKDMPLRQGLKIQAAPAEPAPFALARRAAAIAPRSSLNLVSPGDGRSRLARQWAAAAAALILAGSIAFATRVEMSVRASERAAQARAEQQEAEARTQLTEQTREAEFRRLRALLHLVGTTNDVPVPELFARQLSLVVPESVRLTQLTVARSTNGWDFHVEGFARGQTAGLLERLEQFEQALTNSLFRPRITDSTRRSLFAAGPAGQSGAPRPKAIDESEKAFFITGVVQ